MKPWTGYDYSTDNVEGVSSRLQNLRHNLQDDAHKVYQALQVSLQQHSTPSGARPNFDVAFHENLNIQFENAFNIKARQVGSANQWQVTIDNGPPIFCSVRMEVIGQDYGLTDEVNKKAKVVKDVLLCQGAKWKKALCTQPEGAGKLQSLHIFRKECTKKVEEWDDQERGWGVWNGDRERNRDSRDSRDSRDRDARQCEPCRWREEEEDPMSQVIGKRIVAQFDCASCQHSWTTHNARLRPDGQTVMGQYCSRCGEPGRVSEWREHVKDDWQSWNEGGKRAGMHQSSLCDACREFGNCMGVFYDPFIVSTALSIIAGQWITWKSYSQDMPELLIANMGPSSDHLQVCLQPHVYCASSQPSPPAAPSARAGLPRQQPPVPPRQVPAAPRQPASSAAAAAPRPTSRGPRASASPTPPAPVWRKKGSGEEAPLPALPAPTLPSQSSAARPAPEPANVPPTVAGLIPKTKLLTPTELLALPSEPAICPAAPTRWSKKKHNKIENRSLPAAPKSPERKKEVPVVFGPSSLKDDADRPYLNALPRLRTYQILQAALELLQATDGEEGDKFALAERFLQESRGDYSLTYGNIIRRIPHHK